MPFIIKSSEGLPELGRSWRPATWTVVWETILELPCCGIPLIVRSRVIRRFMLESIGGKQRLLYCFLTYPESTWWTGALSAKTAATGVSCSLNPAAWQAIRTPDLWLEQRSFAPQSTGSRISERDDCAESESSKRFRGVSSVDDAPGTEWVNEWMRLWCCCTFPWHCGPPKPQPPHTQLSPVPPALPPPLFPFLFLCFV